VLVISPRKAAMSRFTVVNFYRSLKKRNLSSLASYFNNKLNFSSLLDQNNRN
jgi:hypothetical protein